MQVPPLLHGSYLQYIALNWKTKINNMKNNENDWAFVHINAFSGWFRKNKCYNTLHNFIQQCQQILLQ